MGSSMTLWLPPNTSASTAMRGRHAMEPMSLQTARTNPKDLRRAVATDLWHGWHRGGARRKLKQQLCVPLIHREE